MIVIFQFTMIVPLKMALSSRCKVSLLIFSWVALSTAQQILTYYGDVSLEQHLLTICGQTRTDIVFVNGIVTNQTNDNRMGHSNLNSSIINLPCSHEHYSGLTFDQLSYQLNLSLKQKSKPKIPFGRFECQHPTQPI